MTESDTPIGSQSILIGNLQQANKLIRSRAVVLSLFLILMIGFSLTIEQGKNELRNLNQSYDQLLRVMNPDSLRTILKRDSLAYFYQTELGAYMSLEVLYDKLARDSFNNPEPLYAAIDQIDEVFRNRKQEHENRTVSILGFSTPIRPIMILGPILLLLLYHDFALIMLYRKGLEDKMRQSNIDIWTAGPENVGHYMLGFIPHKLRYARWLWSVIQMTILFLPIIPAIYFCVYSLSEYKLASAVGWIDGICCAVILLDFLAMVDSENILGIRDFALVFTGKKSVDAKAKFYKRRSFLAICLPVLLFGMTTWAFSDLLAEDLSTRMACAAFAFIFGAVLSVFTQLDSLYGTRKFRVLFSALATGGFFASLFWFIINLLTFFGAIHFKVLSAWDYIWFSILIFAVSAYAKLFYVRIYLKELNTPSSEDSHQDA
jgi:hypothetical protein